MVLTKQGAAK